MREQQRLQSCWLALRLHYHNIRSIAVAVESNASVCDRSIAGIAGSSLTEGIDVRFLCLLCVYS